MKKLIYILIALALVSPSYALDTPVALEQVGNMRSVDFGTVDSIGETAAHDLGVASSETTCYFQRTGTKNVKVQLQAQYLNPVYEHTREGLMVLGFVPWGFKDISEEHTITTDSSTHTLTVSGKYAQFLSIKAVSGFDGSNTVSAICNSGGI